MKYDFTTLPDRRGHDALALDALGRGTAPGAPKPGFDAIPMWVADMNFATVPTVPAALIARASHPTYGYFAPREEYYQSILRWHAHRHGADPDLLTRDCIGHHNGVLGGVVAALGAMARPGDAVLVHSPTYIGFTHALEDNGYRIVHSPLARDENGVWRMDYADMDAKLKAHRIHAAILCSPHNPCGRVWEPEELEQAMAVFKANDCYVISDEIWSDIILDGHRHTPTLSLGQDARRRTVALYAPSKTFNLAGLVGSYHLICDPLLRDRVRANAARTHCNDMNVLSMHALIAAYGPEGEQWVDELCATLTGNVKYACGRIRQDFAGVDVAEPQGTYMLFLDCTGFCRSRGVTLDQVLKAGWDVGVAWQDGRPFHGACSIRMNLALPLSRVQEAFARLDRYVLGERSPLGR